ncbi:hypothetical protein F1721_24815 [Saccharopolyspora hirsuta]|uniref:Uncharacterized protein n=1 Tax=Saccharopolyspora hirsuta TaxID=1837 RepID=A0A5M7BKC6_SACHI|nr:hypothetical protein [Saccharopolyspora hirsuta]KAA5829543.1 hypothetical protein F1721_24815 [Saccharopolyspora hirsuta]
MSTVVKPARRWGIVAVVVLFFAAVGIISTIVGAFNGGAQTEFTSSDTVVYSDSDVYTGTSVQRFTAADAQQLAQGLAEAEKLHGVCFGWKLTDGSTEESDRGSSRGATVPADTCPRWAEVEVFVAAGSTDDDPDAADVRVAGSPDLRPLPVRADFVKLGVTADSLVEEPVTVTGQAALALPLLLVESGALDAPRIPDQEPGSATTPLPPGDGSGSSWVTWAWLGGLGFVVVVALVLGFVARAKQKSTSDGPVPGPPQACPPQPGPVQAGTPTPGPPNAGAGSPGPPPPPPGPPPGGPQPPGPPPRGQFPGAGPQMPPGPPPWPPRAPGR